LAPWQTFGETSPKALTNTIVSGPAKISTT
jgi:hypothetical protein